MVLRPKWLNPGQKLLVARWFVFGLLAYLVVLGVVDLVQMVRALMADPWIATAGRPSSVAIRIVVAGVFFELRGSFVKHLLGEARAAEPAEAHVSEVAEIFGGHLTVVGLFVELTDDTKEILPHAGAVNLACNVWIAILLALSIHVMADMARALRAPA